MPFLLTYLSSIVLQETLNALGGELGPILRSFPCLLGAIEEDVHVQMPRGITFLTVFRSTCNSS